MLPFLACRGRPDRRTSTVPSRPCEVPSVPFHMPRTPISPAQKSGDGDRSSRRHTDAIGQLPRAYHSTDDRPVLAPYLVVAIRPPSSISGKTTTDEPQMSLVLRTYVGSDTWATMRLCTQVQRIFLDEHVLFFSVGHAPQRSDEPQQQVVRALCFKRAKRNNAPLDDGLP